MQKHVQTGVPFHKNLTTDAFSSFGRKSRYVWILSLRQWCWQNSCLLDGAGQEAEAVRRRAPRRRDPVAASCAATGWTPGCFGWWRSVASGTSRSWMSGATESRAAPGTIRLERFHGQRNFATQLGKRSKQDYLNIGFTLKGWWGW